MVRRTRSVRSELQLALHFSEIERLKTIMAKITDGRQLVITPSDPGAGGPTTPGVEAAAHVLYGSKHSRALRVTDNGGIDIAFEQGQMWVGGTFFSIVAGTLTLTDNATNYVFVNNAGAVADNTTGFPGDSAPLALVTTVAADITALADRRAYLAAGTFGGGVILGNPLIIGEEDVTGGVLTIHGEPTGSAEGAQINMHLATDEDTGFAAWIVDIQADDMRFFQSGGGFLALRLLGHATAPTVEVANTLAVLGSALTVGVNDTLSGTLSLFGAAAGNEGAELRMYLTDAHDANFDIWIIDVNADDLRFFQSTGQQVMRLRGSAVGTPDVLFPLDVEFNGDLDVKAQADPGAPAANLLRHWVFDGVGRVGVPVWEDENADLYMATREAAVLIPQPLDAVGGTLAGASLTTTTAQVYLVTVTAPINLDTITYDVSLGGANADNKVRIALYAEDGQTKLVDEIDAVGTATGLRVVTLGADVLLHPGNYYVFVCFESGTGPGPAVIFYQTQGLFETGGASQPDLGGDLTVTAGAAPATFDPTAITTPTDTKCVAFRFDGA